MTEKAILFDSTKCIACRACQVACKQWWELPGVSTTNRGTYENPPNLSAETWNKIKFSEVGQNGTARWIFTRQACMHCSEAVCVWVCPTYARGYDALGYVTIDQERCIGCGRCVVYCPFAAPGLGNHDMSSRINVELSTPRTVAYKCKFCEDRIDNGLEPSCVKTCPTGALDFGERGDLLERGQVRVQTLGTVYPKAYLYGEKELGGLHVMYVLTEGPAVHGLPENPQVGDYRPFDKNAFPGWYIRALTDGILPVFPPEAKPEWYMQPELVPASVSSEIALPGVPEGAETGRTAPAIFILFGLGLAGVAAAVWLAFRRRMSQEKVKSIKR